MNYCMAECYRCGKLGTEVRLFDAISKDGVVQICEDCSRQDNIPVIRRPTTFQLKAAETPSTVYERLSRMTGLNPTEHMEKFSNFRPKRKDLPVREDVSMRQLVEKNYKEKGKMAPRADLVDNFHWVIQRARRFKKITQDQLAREIGESEAVIIMAERGVLPEDDYRLINKLEGYLGIKLLKKNVVNSVGDPFASSSLIVRKKDLPKELNIEDPTAKGLTISELREIRKGYEQKGAGVTPQEEVEEEIIIDEDVEDEE